MTDKLFWEDAYLKHCTAVVTYVDGQDVMLDQTVLFAFSGGQASDQGSINGFTVISSRQIADDIIYTLEGDHGLTIGDEVEVIVDWEYRYTIMKLHSAAHIVHFLFAQKSGEEKLIGSNVSGDKARLDYELDKPVSAYLTDVEKLANAMIELDERAQISFTDEGRRVWACGAFSCECSGTHVRSLGEIGKVKLKRKNIGSGKERIEITLVS